VKTGSFRTIRGRTLLAVVGDETAFWRDETSAQPDVEIYLACIPALAHSGGMFVGISTGYRKVGLLYDKWRAHFGQDSDEVLVIQGGSTQFNATLDQVVIARAQAADSEAAEAEWLGGWRFDLASFLDEATIECVIDYGRPLELPPRKISYTAFIDPSGGPHDHYTPCIGHREGSGSGSFCYWPGCLAGS
jgi:hypothetical protein